MLKCSGEAAFFARACRRARQTQAELLHQMLHENRDTWFGRRHDFATIDSPQAFQQRVPPATFDDFAPLVERIAAGEANVLTREPVLLLEPTSGTSGVEKLIPYTAGLRRQFQRGIAAWIADLFYHRPAVRAGRAYWSISPPFGPRRRSAGGLPIGFDEDAAYLGRLEQVALRKLLVAPDDLSRQSNMPAFRLATLRCLLAAEDLALISVWSPTFLTALISWLAEPEALAKVIQSFANASGSDRHARLQSIWQSSASLLEKLRRPGRGWRSSVAGPTPPRGNSSRSCENTFQASRFSRKGCWPPKPSCRFRWWTSPEPPWHCARHFSSSRKSPAIAFRLAHQLDRGGRYRVLATTAGGLIAINCATRSKWSAFIINVRCCGFWASAIWCSDLVGEKLAEEHVRTVLSRLPALAQVSPRFQLLVPVIDRPPRYRLYLQVNSPSPDWPAAVQRELQLGLEENPYYRHAVAAGQLAPVEVALLDNDGESAWLIYERRCLERGQKAGGIKPAALDRWTGWPDCFAPLLTSADRPVDARPNPGSSR